MAQMIADAVGQAWRNFLDDVVIYLPRLLAALSIIVVGWVIAMLIKLVVHRVLAWLQFDALSERVGLSTSLRALELRSASAVSGTLAFWLVWIGFLLSAVDVLEVPALQGIVTGFFGFVPNLIVALAILGGGIVVANFAWRATLLAAVNMGFPSPRVLSGIVRFLVVVLAAAMALEQIAVGRTVVITAFAIGFGALMLGLAIAFGIGGGGLARRVLERHFSDRPSSDDDEVSHV